MNQATILALPRSGTAWASVWLGFVHDPLDRHSPEQAAALPGVCCTAMWMFPKLLRLRKGPIILLDRPFRAVQHSLRRQDLPDLPAQAADLWRRLEYPRFEWTDLWSPQRASAIWQIMKPTLPFDAERHRELTRLNIQVNLDTWNPQGAEHLRAWL